MTFTYDMECDALYIHLRDSEAVLQQLMEPHLRQEETSAGLIIDIDGDGKVRGIEVLGASQGNWKIAEVIDRYNLDVATAAQLLALEEKSHLFRF